MNFFSINHLKKITKASLALVLASSFTFSSITFAEEGVTETTNSYETVDLQKLQTQLEDTQAETPSLIPGDFLYFAKIAFEKIKLAFTFDNAKEAELMATYASERLAEAAALYGEGKEAEAVEVIQAAIEYMEGSQAIIDEETNTEETASDESESTTEGNENVTEESNQEDSTTDEETPIVEDETDETPGEFTEVENTLRHNIIALTAAMQHVGNDQARASLQKNIDKTYAKIAKKLAKLEKKYGKTEPIEDNTIEGTEENTDNTEEVVTPTPIPTTENSESTPVTNGSTDEEINTTISAPKATESVNITNTPTPQGKGYEKKQENKPEKKAVEKGNSAAAHQKNQQNKGNKKEEK
ncbi:DUF5667 domain-containing protein [Bacillus marasmi]|uniref:DUF5667 domain-containing protein n=1 Tax=Bacillus marasmi TaxID=1926279 RepID=UPI0011CADF10|nr:DUF5667 domain-containing protein [Bacillus marasmi]